MSSAGSAAPGAADRSRSSVPSRIVGVRGRDVVAAIGDASIEPRPRTSSSRALLNTAESPRSVTVRGTIPTRARIAGRQRRIAKPGVVAGLGPGLARRENPRHEGSGRQNDGAPRKMRAAPLGLHSVPTHRLREYIASMTPLDWLMIVVVLRAPPGAHVVVGPEKPEYGGRLLPGRPRPGVGRGRRLDLRVEHRVGAPRRPGRRRRDERRGAGALRAARVVPARPGLGAGAVLSALARLHDAGVPRAAASRRRRAGSCR